MWRDFNLASGGRYDLRLDRQSPPVTTEPVIFSIRQKADPNVLNTTHAHLM